MGGSTKTALLSGLLGAVLGALGMWLATHGFTTSPTDGPAATPAGVAGETLKSDRPVPIAPPEAPRLDARTPEGGPSGSTATLAAAIEALVIETPQGHGTITGHVRTKDGAPLEGAVVRGFTMHRSWPRDRVGTVPSLPTVEASVRTFALDAKWNAAAMRETRTDKEGAYVLKDLVDAPCELGAWAVGYEIRRAGRDQESTLPGATVDFEANSVVPVLLTVLMPDGTTAVAANVFWSLPKRGGGGGGSWTTDDPVVEMEPGTWSVVAQVREQMRSKPVTVTAGATTDPVVLRLETRNAIEGTVHFDAADKDWVYATVEARRRGAASTDRADTQSPRAPDWTFRFGDLEAGDYDIIVWLADLAPLATQFVHVEGGTATVTLAIPRLGPAQVLEARVYGPDGNILGESDVGFSLTERTPTAVTGLGARAVRRPDGTFLIPLTSPRRMTQARAPGRTSGPDAARGVDAGPPTDDGPVRWSLQVRSKAHGAKEAEFVFGVTPRVEIRFDRSEGR